jgi:hypothetical protein
MDMDAQAALRFLCQLAVEYAKTFGDERLGVQEALLARTQQARVVLHAATTAPGQDAAHADAPA